MESTALLPATRSNNQLDSLGDKRDRADSEAIYSIFKALQPLASRRLAVVNRALREAIQKIWQEPRMPKGKTRIFSHNKPLDFPWSPNARDLYFSHRTDASVAITGQLVLEHVTPINILVNGLLSKVAEVDCTEEKFYELLLQEHEPLSFVVLTKEDDNALTRAGLKSAGVVEEGASAWARYEKGCGLTEEDFIGVTADPRFSGELAANRG
jgi:hypothetical protein